MQQCSAIIKNWSPDAQPLCPRAPFHALTLQNFPQSIQHIPASPLPEGRRTEEGTATLVDRSCCSCGALAASAVAAPYVTAAAANGVTAAAVDVFGGGGVAMAVVAAASAAPAGLCHRPKLAPIPLCVPRFFYSAGGRFNVWEMSKATVISWKTERGGKTAQLTLCYGRGRARTGAAGAVYFMAPSLGASCCIK